MVFILYLFIKWPIQLQRLFNSFDNNRVENYSHSGIVFLCNLFNRHDKRLDALLFKFLTNLTHSLQYSVLMFVITDNQQNVIG